MGVRRQDPDSKSRGVSSSFARSETSTVKELSSNESEGTSEKVPLESAILAYQVTLIPFSASSSSDSGTKKKNEDQGL